jgi:hypothetical protein
MRARARETAPLPRITNSPSGGVKMRAHVIPLFTAATLSACATQPSPPAIRPAALGPASNGSGDGRPGLADGERRGLMRVPTAAAGPPPPDWREAFASLYVVAQTRDMGPALVRDGARLHSGETIDFHLRVARTAWVYLIQVFPDGEAIILSPNDHQPERLASGVEHRVPADPRESFELDEITGTEEIMLIASERPLGPAERDLTSLVSFVRERRRLPDPWRPASGAPPGGGAGARRR